VLARVNARELKRFRLMLVELKRKLTNSIGSLRNDALKSAGETVDELSDVPAEHMAERGSDSFARDLMIRVLQDSDAELCDINVALEKIDAGAYGLCEMCSKKIPKKRLRALPFARLCIECKQAEEQLSSAP
jgi:DnaK suppressor protein